jgi:polar amino acid transport system substrate-binding protein
MNIKVVKTAILSVGPLIILIILMNIWKKPAQEDYADELIVGTNSQFPPFEFIKDGMLMGFDIDLIHAVANKLNKKVIFKDMAFDMLLLQATTGDLQVIAAGMTPTEERAKKVLFTKTYIGNDDPLIAISNKQNIITKLEDLYGKEVIVNDGYTAQTHMKKFPEITVKPLPSVADAFLALNNNRAFAFITAQNTLVPFFEKYGKENYNIFPLDFFEPAALAISKSHSKLLEPIQKALDELEHDGTINNLKTKWHVK